MHNRQLPTQEEILQAVLYDPDTGNFYSKSTYKSTKFGRLLNKVNNAGYIGISINRKRYLAHRIAWVCMTGNWPKQIDHIDGNRINNIFTNLREATKEENSKNRSRKITSKSNYKGVTYLPRIKKWQARVSYQGDRIYLGVFMTEELAAKAYMDKAKELYGEFYTERGNKKC